MQSAKKVATAQLSQQFPLYFSIDFDFAFTNASWPVAVSSCAPEDLKRRLAAALISHQLGTKSIDYTLKRYMAGSVYPEADRSRLDLQLTAAINEKNDDYTDFVLLASCLEHKLAGSMVAEWTLIRLPFAIGVMIACAHRGAFFEVCTLARACLEQMAWAARVHGENNVADIEQTSATRAISEIKHIVGYTGKLYGWLRARPQTS